MTRVYKGLLWGCLILFGRGSVGALASDVVLRKVAAGKPTVESCANLSAQIHQVRDVDQINQCLDFYLAHPDLIVGDTFYSRAAILQHRLTELTPEEPQVFLNLAWTQANQWVLENLKPGAEPRGVTGVEDALDTLEQGRRRHSLNPTYYVGAALNIFPVAHKHLPELWDVVRGYCFRANILLEGTNDPESFRRWILARLILGHSFRLDGRIPESRTWYRRTLELQPDNKIALKYLKQFDSQ